MAAEQIGEVRRSRGGGWKGSPNSIAALLRSGVPIPQGRKCRKCGQLALRDSELCRMHVGRSRLSPGAGRAESRMLAALERCGLLPLELLSLPVWRNLAGLPTGTRAPMRVQLVQAWDKRDRAPLHWAKVQRQAIDLGAQSGRRQNVAWYYENR